MWRRLDEGDLRTALSKEELAKLDSVEAITPTAVGAPTIAQQALDDASDAFRGAFIAKGYTIDSREHYTPGSYKPFILAFARWTLWNRFPNADSFALSESRKLMLDKAFDLLKTPYIGVDTVDPSGGGGSGGGGSEGGQTGAASIMVPWQRIPDDPPLYWSNFKSYALSNDGIGGQEGSI